MNISHPKVLFRRTSKQVSSECHSETTDTRKAGMNTEAVEASLLYFTKHSLNIKHLEKLYF